MQRPGDGGVPGGAVDSVTVTEITLDPLDGEAEDVCEALS